MGASISSIARLYIKHRLPELLYIQIEVLDIVATHPISCVPDNNHVGCEHQRLSDS